MQAGVLRQDHHSGEPLVPAALPDPEPAYQLAERLIAEGSPEAAAFCGHLRWVFRAAIDYVLELIVTLLVKSSSPVVRPIAPCRPGAKAIVAPEVASAAATAARNDPGPAS